MKPQEQQEHIRHMFDAYCKKVLKYKARTCYKKLQEQEEREVTFSELTERDMAELATTDEYFRDEYTFHAYGETVSVSDYELAEALNGLPQDRREIVLMSYFFDMTDKEIADKLNLARRTVQYRRTSTLKELKKMLEED
ncbi:MAG: sigma-70 family RNA polymerase sigma factor [Treponema sp.]|jgi:DNA-directed RNA polymerase specialized sigma24 family protein|nr:sigma-70 family RNA polymerase sigma factor [Treponema sp.]